MPILIIAEAGVNHNGSLELAKKMVDVAAEAKCDYVKFQTFKAENVVTRSAPKAKYQIENTGNIESQYSMIKKLELNIEAHKSIVEYCKGKNIEFLSSPFDEESVDLLDEIGVSVFKIPSGEITNKPYIKQIASKNKPIILSTGMSTLKEIEEALIWIYEEGNKNVTLLHCTSNYPTLIEDVNLKAMNTLKEAFKLNVGYSDHTLGIEVSIAAAALGAQIIEKHFTLNKNLDGPDHKASLSPEELKQLVNSIRKIEIALGTGKKEVRPNEIPVRDIARKSIVAKGVIESGEIITFDRITYKRPGTGIEPKLAEKIVGMIAVDKIVDDELITWDKLKNI